MCSMHVLVNTWARDRMAKEDFRLNSTYARTIMFASLSNRRDDEAVQLRRKMLPHLHCCLALTDVVHPDDTTESRYLGKFALPPA